MLHLDMLRCRVQYAMKTKGWKTMARIGLGLALVVLGIVSRTFFSRNYAYPLVPFLGNNFEIVTVIGVVAGLVFGLRWGWIVPVFAMVGSDLILGNSSEIVWFTWTGFAFPAVAGGAIRALVSKVQRLTSVKVLHRSLFQAIGGFGGSIVSVLFFFVWTNFGVWLFWYSKTFEGLVQCYTLALPFLGNQLKGNLIAAGLAFGLYFTICVFPRYKDYLSPRYR